MSDPTAPVEGAPTSTETAPSSSPEPWAPVLDRMSELAGTIDTKFAALEGRIPEPAAPAETDPWAALFGEPDPAAPADPYATPAQPQLDPQALQSAIQAAISQSNAPLLERLQNFETQQATQRLYSEIPQLAEVPPSHPDYAAHQAARQDTHQRVTASLANYPTEIANALVADPNYIATIFKAAEAEKLAQGQAPASEQVPNVESAGGALPGGNGAPVNPVHQAYGANRHEMPKGFA